MKLTIGSPPKQHSRESYGCKGPRMTPKKKLINALRKRCKSDMNNQLAGQSLSISVRSPFGAAILATQRALSVFFLNARNRYSSIIMNGVYFIGSFLAERYLCQIEWTPFVIPMSKLKSQLRLIYSLPSMAHL